LHRNIIVSLLEEVAPKTPGAETGSETSITMIIGERRAHPHDRRHRHAQGCPRHVHVAGRTNVDRLGDASGIPLALHIINAISGTPRDDGADRTSGEPTQKEGPAMGLGDRIKDAVDNVKDKVSDAGDTAGDAGREAQDKAGDMGRDAQNDSGGAMGDMKDAMKDAGDKAGDMGRDAQNKVDDRTSVI